MAMAMAVLAMLLLMMKTLDADNTNGLYQPCGDTKIQRSDGFTFGIAFSTKDSFYYNQNLSHQLSPCDRRLSLATLNSQLAVFRPKVDGISLLTINTSSFSPVISTHFISFSFSFSNPICYISLSYSYVHQFWFFSWWCPDGCYCYDKYDSK